MADRTRTDGPIQAFVFGRVLADLYPLQSETLLEDVRTFERFVGGYGDRKSTRLNSSH